MYQTSAETDHSHVSKHADPDWCVPTQMFGTWQGKGITTADWLACTLCKSSNMLMLAGLLAVKSGLRWLAAVPGDGNGLVNLQAVERSWQSRSSHSNQEALMGCWL